MRQKRPTLKAPHRPNPVFNDPKKLDAPSEAVPANLRLALGADATSRFSGSGGSIGPRGSRNPSSGGCGMAGARRGNRLGLSGRMTGSRNPSFGGCDIDGECFGVGFGLRGNANGSRSPSSGGRRIRLGASFRGLCRGRNSGSANRSPRRGWLSFCSLPTLRLSAALGCGSPGSLASNMGCRMDSKSSLL